MTGRGVSVFVASVDPALDATVRSQIDAALAALTAAGPSFDATLHDNPQALRAAQHALLALNQTLTQRVGPLVGGIVEDSDWEPSLFARRPSC